MIDVLELVIVLAAVVLLALRWRDLACRIYGHAKTIRPWVRLTDLRETAFFYDGAPRCRRCGARRPTPVARPASRYRLPYLSASFLLGASILGGCAAGHTQLSGPGTFDQSLVEKRPRLLGEPGESPRHFFARFLARVCAGDESEPVVRQVLRDLGDGVSDVEICASFSEAPSCTDSLAKTAALDRERAELDAILAGMHRR